MIKRFKKVITNSSKFISLLFFVSASLMLFVAIVVSVYINRMDMAVETVTQNHLLAAARAASTFLSVEELELFKSGKDMERPEWEKTKMKLRQFAEDYRVLYVYYWRDYGNGQIQYIIDNDYDEEEMATPEMFFDIYGDPLTSKVVPTVMAGGVWASDLGAYTESWDNLISAIAPVYNADGTVYCAAGVDLGDELILAQRQNIRLLRIVLFGSLILSVLSGSLAMFMYRKKAQQSENANRAKSEFLSTMSHEIRTPLNAVIGLSEIELRGDLSEESRRNIQQIHHSGSSLMGIVNDILDISKIEAGAFDLIPVEYETASLINDAVNFNRIRIGAKPIDFILELEAELPKKLRGDELRIKRILNNILSNAIKYTREGSITFTVNWDASNGAETASDGVLRLLVRDTGIGIRREDMKKLFTDYTRFDTRSNRKIEGTGLGLAIVKELLDMMGGKISVQSEYGVGSAFSVDLLQSVVDSSPIGEETAEKLKSFQYSGLDDRTFVINRSRMPYGKVLIVDDMPVNLHVARGLLEPYGLNVDVALSGREAVEKVCSKDPDPAFRGDYDIIFMDHLMPDMDGIEAVSAIRNWENRENKTGNSPKHVPIIALTANALAGNSEMFMSRGFNGFIPKPIDLMELDRVLNQWIRDKGPEPNSKTIGLYDRLSSVDGTIGEDMTMEKKLIMLVDDNPANLRIGKNVLSEKYTVATAPSAAKLFGLLENNRPVLILLDIDMPEMDGYEAIKILKSKPETSDIPIIFLTGMTDSRDEEKGRALGAIDYIVKPFDPQALIACIEKHTQTSACTAS